MAHDGQGLLVHGVGGGGGVRPRGGQGSDLAADVEVLADGDLGRHGVEGAAGTVTAGGLEAVAAELDGGEAAHLPGCQGQQHVTQEEGAVAPEGLRVPEPARVPVQAGQAPVRGRHAPSGLGGVDDVVVHEGTGLVELEGRADARDHGRGQGLLPLDAVEQQDGAEGAEQGPGALAPAEQVRGGVQQLVAGGPEAVPAATVLLEDLGEAGIDAGAHTLADAGPVAPGGVRGALVWTGEGSGGG